MHNLMRSLLCLSSFIVDKWITDNVEGNRHFTYNGNIKMAWTFCTKKRIYGYRRKFNPT